MRIALVVLLMLSADSVLAGPVTSPSQWTITHTGHFTYLMPPRECLIGPIPDYELIFISQTELDESLPPGHPKGMHLFAIHDHVDDEAVIYISASLPHRPRVFQDILNHEKAHLRGCEHGDYEWTAAHSLSD